MRRDETRWGQKKKEGTNAKKDRWMGKKEKIGHREDNDNIGTKVWTEETEMPHNGKEKKKKGRENNKKTFVPVCTHICVNYEGEEEDK